MFLLWWVPFKIAFSPDSDETILNLEQALVYFMVFDLLIKLNVGIID
jgi:cyclic nucleotide gated channel alpha 1